jgi:hypothetical protein
MTDWTLKLAAGLLALSGLGFGIPCVIGIRSIAAGHGVPLVMGFPSYGGGPFERVGIPSTVPLLVAFLVVCALEVVAAWLVWDGRRAGAILALGLLVPELVFWIGFALPFGPVLGLARAGLVIAGWSRFG